MTKWWTELKQKESKRVAHKELQDKTDLRTTATTLKLESDVYGGIVSWWPKCFQLNYSP
jgi:outer membrane receptor for monomeric catechols